MRVGVVGCGVVGSAVADGMERSGHIVFRCDPKFGKTTKDLIEFMPDVVYICVPTPSASDGSCDTSIVEKVVYELIPISQVSAICVKSTVPPGTTRRLSEKYDIPLSFVPEFLRERSAFHDFMNQEAVICGAANALHESRIQHSHTKFSDIFHYVTPTEAETIKYYSNCFNAIRVVFANTMYEICRVTNADYDKVKNAFMSLGTASDIYMDVNENFRGYSGPCLPKDMKAIIGLMKEKGINLRMFEAADEDNSKFKPTVPEGMRNA
jgi:UDPglucose 6-dehydrogenase